MSFDVLAVLAKKNENRRWTNREILPSLFYFSGFVRNYHFILHSFYLICVLIYKTHFQKDRNIHKNSKDSINKVKK